MLLSFLTIVQIHTREPPASVSQVSHIGCFDLLPRPSWKLAQVDSCDAIIVAGYSSSTDLDGQTNAGENDVMVMKFSSAGTHQWTVLLGGSSHDRAYGLEADTASPEVKFWVWVWAELFCGV